MSQGATRGCEESRVISTGVKDGGGCIVGSRWQELGKQIFLSIPSWVIYHVERSVPASLSPAGTLRFAQRDTMPGYVKNSVSLSQEPTSGTRKAQPVLTHTHVVPVADDDQMIEYITPHTYPGLRDLPRDHDVVGRGKPITF